ncbi:MAG: hypothetical protein ACRDUV_00645 [Pseudonocardiaceae bacterium]
MTAPQCPACGALQLNLRPPGRLIIIDDTDIGRLRNLLGNDVDVDRCAGCMKQVGVVPTVFVLFPDDTLVLYAAGTLLAGTPDAVASIDWRPFLRRPDAVPHLVQYADLDALRAAVRQRLSAHVATLRPLLEAVVQGCDRKYLAEHWRDYRPAVLAALTLAVQFPGPDLHLDSVEVTDAQRAAIASHDLAPLVLPDATLPVQQHLALIILQLRVWQALCGEWTGRTLSSHGDPPVSAVATSLHDDLETYVAGGALLDCPLSLLADEDLAAGLSPYVWRALQAAVAWALGEPNPHAEQWAELFFAHETACRLGPDGVPARLAAAQLPAGFARATIDYQAAWHATSRLYATLQSDGQLGARSLPESYEIVHAIAEKAGYPRLAAAVLETALGSALDATASADEIATASADEIATAVLSHAGARTLPAVLALAGLHLDKQLPARRAETTDRVAQRLLAALGLDAEADVVAWWVNRLNRDQRFADTEQVLNDYPVPDDAPVPASTRARLWGARAAALAGRGRLDEALQVWRQIVDLLADDANRELVHWARVNLGIALASTGSPDQALSLFEDIAYGPDGYGSDPELLALMARLHVRFGSSQRAVDLLADAQRLAGAAPAAYRYAQQRAQQLVALGRDGEAIELLLAVAQHEQPHDTGALLAEAASWAMLLARDTELPAAAGARARQMPTLLAERAEQAAATGDVTNHLALLSRRAEFAQLLGAAAGPLWEHVVGQRRHHGLPDVPEELVQAARARHDAGDLAGMRQLLGAVPPALARTYGAVSDIELLVREPRSLLRPLAELAGRVFSGAGGDWPDARLIAELQRDAVGRARTAHLDRGAAAEQPDTWLSDGGPEVPPDAGALVVVEWIRTGAQSLRCVLTRTDAGQAGSAFLRLAPVDPVVLQERLNQQLADWRGNRSGDPLDHPGWRELASSMATEISRYARDGDHIVFLHNEVYANLPWHITIGARWTVSYAAGWTHLLGLLAAAPAPRRRIGICTVPRFGDPAGTVEALRASAHRAALAAVDALRSPVEQCDRHYLEKLMDSVDVALLLCHGYRPWRGEEIGLMLAHEGRLPLADAVSSAKVLADHLFSWRDCLRLKRAPRTVLSAACSSAHSYGAGLGDRLGLFNALRHAGTTAMVAPAWYVIATDVLPVLDDVTARYLGGEPLGQALRAACQEAAAHALPDWLAWSLALEGDWR